MIIGIGIDAVDIQEFKRLFDLGGKNFLNLILTENERKRVKPKYPVKKLAGFFSVKEAVFKSLNLSKFEIKDSNYFQEIEVNHLPCGKPEVNFSGFLAKKFPKQKFRIFVSITYSFKMAICFAIMEKI
jgi:phosphopantetheine--protein transferase-like protein